MHFTPWLFWDLLPKFLHTKTNRTTVSCWTACFSRSSNQLEPIFNSIWHMKEAKNWNREWSRGGNLRRNQTRQKLQSTKEQTKRVFYSLTGKGKELVKCCVLKNYNLKLSVVLPFTNSNCIYWKREEKMHAILTFKWKDLQNSKLQMYNRIMHEVRPNKRTSVTKGADHVKKWIAIHWNNFW